ncbi:hypothetical protein PFMALIP_00470 [Plasmodium falciparum MaliPS096_E11]|uniref:40S ribosomal protein S12 n=1 Tax=Plasmodium falciparum MaliPS096_E11 TaxID=1036727 RepID=A0A024WW67_PLAFA|nr:hypothetical protein PFMALIP_00470 [Plasmodium falciparum MaliPS096_E11]
MSDVESADNNVVVEEKAVFDNVTAIQKVRSMPNKLKKKFIFKIITKNIYIQINILFIFYNYLIPFLIYKIHRISRSKKPAYKKLITTLCAEKNIPLFMVQNDSKDLGHWAGLFKLDNEGNARKIIGASSVAVVDFGEDSAEKDFLLSQNQTKDGKIKNVLKYSAYKRE